MVGFISQATSIDMAAKRVQRDGKYWQDSMFRLAESSGRPAIEAYIGPDIRYAARLGDIHRGSVYFGERRGFSRVTRQGRHDEGPRESRMEKLISHRKRA